MTDTDGPVVVTMGDELLLFSSVGAAVGSMEAIDVEEGAYQAAYSRTGDRLRLGVTKTPTTHLFGLVRGTRANVTISFDSATPARTDELATIIRAHLATHGEHVPEGTSLDVLLMQMEKRDGFTS